MKFLPLTALFLCLFQYNFAAYSGRVFVDTNLSSVFDKGDSPLQGIVVTDGRNTVKTAKDGRFSLPGYEKTRFITITTPAGYRLASHYIRVDASVKSYDFALTKEAHSARNEHSFIQITDTEIHTRGVADNWANYLKKYIQNEKSAFLIHTGDICYENGLKSHIQVVNPETMGCPVYYAIGNHDLVQGKYGEELFESIYGPCWYSFDVGNVHYVVTPMTGGDYKPGYTREEVYRWLKNDLAMMQPGKQLIIFNHDILTTGNDFYFGMNESERIDLRNYNLKAWIYGHWHINYVRNQEGIYTVCTATLDKGGIDHSASAFRVVQVGKDDIVDMNLQYCFADKQVTIVSPAPQQAVFLTKEGKVPLSVNAYYSGSRTKSITYATRPEGENTFGAPVAMKQVTDWNWVAGMPLVSYDAGKTIEIQVVAEFADGSVSTSRKFSCLPATTGTVTTNTWANLLGDMQHTGSAQSSLKQPLQLAWVSNIGANIFMSSPLIVGTRIFVASIDDSNIKNTGVYALDVQTGNILWKYQTRNSVKNSIAYDQETIFAQDAEGMLYAIEASSGKLRWEKKLNLDSFPYMEEGLIAGNGIVYAGTGKGLGAFHCNDGKEIWVNTAWKQHEAATTTLTLGNGVLTAGTQWGALYGNDAKTGALLWSISKDGMSDRGASTTLHEGNFYVISRKSLFIISPQSGEILNRKELSEFNLDVTSTPLVTDTEIIFGTADKGIVALDKHTLGIKWNTSTGQSLVYTAPYSTIPFATVETSPVLSNGIIYFGASDGYLYGLKAGTGQVVWKMQTGAPVLASVALSGNILVAADFSGNVYNFISL